jgi:carnosine N-methyltransferase
MIRTLIVILLSHCSSQIHPWLLSTCNQLTNDAQLRAVTIPDRPPAEIVASAGLLSMCAGDFIEVYSTPGSRHAFDCVVTCFFIDTAHNIVEVRADFLL